VFSALRVAIDEKRGERGRFVMTGSSSPELLRSVSETLAGRVGIIELSPLSWQEVTNTIGRDSILARLLDRKAKPTDLLEGLRARGDLAQAHAFWFRGGFPEPWLAKDVGFRGRWTDQYLQTYLYRDVKRLFPGLDELRFRRFAELLGGLSGHVLNYADTARALAVSQPTARDYFDIAHGTFLWRRIPAFSRNATKRLVEREVDGVKLRVLPLERVIASKRATRRAKDLAQLPADHQASVLGSTCKAEPSNLTMVRSFLHTN
jgi:predicted AAA+ superfamily ATPase